MCETCGQVLTEGRPGLSLEGSLKRSFADEARWPIERGGLAALIDLGLTSSQIADYFGVRCADLRTLRETYGLS